MIQGAEMLPFFQQKELRGRTTGIEPAIKEPQSNALPLGDVRQTVEMFQKPLAGLEPATSSLPWRYSTD